MNLTKRIILFLLFLPSLTIFAQEKELNGTLMGSVSVDYTTSSPSTTANTWANAFDGDYNTMFASYDRSNTWVGMDLKTKHVITKVAYAPRTSWGKRMLLGVFEGANQPDFTDAIPIGIIKETPEDKKMTEMEINCSRGFRYVRYVGPNDVRCNVSELRFYGEEGEGDDHQLYQLTNLPTIVMHTFDNKPVESKTVRIGGIIKVISENGTALFTDTMGVRGRGNASWGFAKKPYSIKLNNKAHLCGLPAKDKRWTLLSNEGDKTLIRNLLAFETSRRMGMNYTPAGTLVDVMLNGEYKGTFQLCDQVEVGKNRVEITKMDSTCIHTPEMTGGYLIEIDAYASGEPVHFTSNRGNPVTVKSPDDDEIRPIQLSYIKNAFNQMETTVYSTYYADRRNGYTSKLDVGSFLKNFLIGEYTGNTDTYYSVFMSKDRGAFEKFKVAAVWDFDIAFENDNRTYPINTKTGSTYIALGGTSSAAGNMKTFVTRIINNETDSINYYWSIARDKGFCADQMLAYTDSLAEAIDESQQLNFTRWPILSTKKHMNFQALGSYEAEVEFLKKYVAERFTWMDNKIKYVPGAVGIKSIDTAQENIIANNKGIQINGIAENSHYDIYTPAGLLVQSGSIENGKNIISVPAGFYIVRVTTNNGKKIQQKVLVK